MKKAVGLLGTLVVTGLGVLALSVPAQAETPNCLTVTVTDRSGPDSGENGNNWATAKLDRKLTVCATEKPDTGDWTYKATVSDNGTFVTLPGNSPGAGTEAQLVGGFTGKVVGGFEATFTAPRWADDFKLTVPAKEITTGKWVETAFPGATFVGGAVKNWGWTYTTCDGKGEKWVNAHNGNSGDITEKKCAIPTTPPATKPPTQPKNCEAYRYTGTSENLCDRFANVAAGDRVKCEQVKYRVTLLDYKVDPWGLDGVVGPTYTGDRGVGCESNPRKPISRPTTTTSPASNNGGLPVTGDSTGKAVVIGGILLVGGVIATVVARKRRTKFETN